MVTRIIWSIFSVSHLLRVLVISGHFSVLSVLIEAEVCLGLRQIAMMELFANVVNGLRPLTILPKSLIRGLTGSFLNMPLRNIHLFIQFSKISENP